MLHGVLRRHEDGWFEGQGKRSHPRIVRSSIRLQEELVKMAKWVKTSGERRAGATTEARIHDPMRRWKLSATDLNSRTRWVDYSRAKDEMFVHTDIPEAPWFVVPADDNRSARLNCMAHLLSRHPYVPKTLEALEMPERQHDEGYVRPPREIYTYVPDHAARVMRAADP
jgi:hypothetical protein